MYKSAVQLGRSDALYKQVSIFERETIGLLYRFRPAHTNMSFFTKVSVLQTRTIHGEYMQEMEALHQKLLFRND